MNLSYKASKDPIWAGLPKLRLPNAVINKKLGLILDTCACCILVLFYLAYRNKITRLREIYRPHPVPYINWYTPSVRQSREWLVSMTGYSKGQITTGLQKLVHAGYIAKRDSLDGSQRDSNSRFTVPEYTLLNPVKGCSLEPVDPSVRNGNISYAYRDVLVASGLDYFSVPLYLFTVPKKGTASIFASMIPSEKRLYTVLCWLATQHRNSRFETTADELKALTGLCMATLKKGFGLLTARWLVWNSNATMRIIMVHLRNPITGELLRYDGVRTECDPRNNQANYYEQTQTGSRRLCFKMARNDAESLFLRFMEEAGISVNPEKNGAEWKFCCPFHDDSTPSCNYSPSLGTFHCFGCDEAGTSYKLFMKLGAVAGNDNQSIIQQMASHLGKTLEYIRPDAEAIRISSYCDRQGRVVKEEVRYPDRPDGGKDIRQRRPSKDGAFIWNVKGRKPMLYNLQYLDGAGVIVITEGPKDADTVTNLGLSGGHYTVVGTTTG
jgi:hypothetical protein